MPMIDETNIPRYAMFRGRKVRVVEYLGDNKFQIVDTDDSTRSVYRGQITFLPDNAKKG